MKKDNEPILKKSLSTLLKRFSNTDIVSTLEKDYSESVNGQIKLSLIKDNHILKRARINEEYVKEAMEDISQKGITSPLFVIKIDDYYEIVLSRTVYIAALKLNLEYVPVSILHMSEEEMLVMLASYLRDQKKSSIVELSLVLNTLQKKYKYTQKDIAVLMKQSRSQITNIMRLKKMPQYILNDLANNKLSFGHARAISTLEREKMDEIVQRIYNENLSVRDVEKIVAREKGRSSYLEEEEALSKKFDCESNISSQRVVLTFDDPKKQEEFLKKIKDL